jgi:two-component system NtrC family response regulator
MKAHILVVEDEEAQRQMLLKQIRDWKHDAIGARGLARAREILARERIDILITDMKLPDGDGLELLHEVRERNPNLIAVLITAFGTIDTAVEAIRLGAFDFLTKPIDLDKLELVLVRAIEKRSLVEENRILRERLASTEISGQLITRSPKMEPVLALAQRVAEGDSSVLITGESGTGKEVLARAIQRAGPRRDQPFLPVNCGALSPTLLESELFGHEKGSFTGATARRVGRFEAADGGTLFLDEVADVPLEVQVKFLRVLQEGEFERVGGSETLRTDVRIIAATHRELKALVAEGKFREDLYYRLNVVEVEIPPLRERREDIPALAEHFLTKYAQRTHRGVKGFEPEAIDRLTAYDFPGNIRELENIVERALVVTRTEWITPRDLPPGVAGQPEPILGPERGDTPLADFLDSIERGEIEAALHHSSGRQADAARDLGLSERALRYKMRKYGLSSQQFG